MIRSYKTFGTCSVQINFEVEDNIVKSVEFVGGCNGNTKGISKLVVGMNIDDVIAKLEGIRCGIRPTSCPDQLAKALKEYKELLNYILLFQLNPMKYFLRHPPHYFNLLAQFY